MEQISKNELTELLKGQKAGEQLSLTDRILESMDLSGFKLLHVDFQRSRFQEVCLDGVDFTGSSIRDTLMDGCSLKGSVFRNTDMRGASMRGCNMTGCDIRGANLFSAVLEYAVLEDVISDEHTRWYQMHCPEKGAILGYKKCVNDRLVQLLIPASAKRTSATLPSCRCNKAKVLTIKSFDGKKEYEEAWSFVDENFVYRKGSWVEVGDFNEDRWMDSTTGIHFWLTREEAIRY